MRVIRVDLRNLKHSRIPMCACIGYFDGLHRGHQKLIQKTVEMGKKYHCETALITFDPDPWVVIKGMSKVKHISTMSQRMNLAVSMGIDNIVLLNFTRDMSELSPQDFIDRVLGSLNLKGLVCGFDYGFGYKGQGTAEYLKEHAPFEVQIVEPVTDEEGKISSTRISTCIVSGQMEEANAMLGYRFNIEGKVVHGKHRGTDMGFPTANVSYSSEYLLPKTGVYAGYAIVDGVSHPCMINIGTNPTFHDIDHMSLEAHLLHFSGDLYDKKIRIEFLKFIRPEKAFRSRENLILQLDQDLRDIEAYLETVNE
jgi:riboflavin kinase/FMN adenylyltransferase